MNKEKKSKMNPFPAAIVIRTKLLRKSEAERTKSIKKEKENYITPGKLFLDAHNSISITKTANNRNNKNMLSSVFKGIRLCFSFH